MVCFINLTKIELENENQLQNSMLKKTYSLLNIILY